MDLATLGTHDALVGIGVALVGYIAQHEPLAIGTPFIVEATVLTEPLTAIGDLRHLLGLQVDHLQFDAVLDECQLCAVGAILRILALYLREVELTIELQGWQFGEHALFFNQRGIGKVEVFLAHDAGRIELPVAIALRGIDDGAPIGGEVHIGLGTCRLRDATGGGILGAGDKHLATGYEGHLLTITAHHSLARTTGEGEVGDDGFVVACQRDAELLRL